MSPHDIVYPQGCRPVSDDLGPDELIRRLKVSSYSIGAFMVVSPAPWMLVYLTVFDKNL